MNICADQTHNVFRLDTPRFSFALALADGKWLGQVYCGPRLGTADLAWALALDQRPNTPDTLPRETVSFFDCFPSAYPAANMGDFREPCLAVRTVRGQIDCLPRFKGYEIIPGKPALEGLPATFGGPEDCNTLKITLADDVTGVEVELYYTAFTGLDVIAQSVRVCNGGESPVWLERALSACLSLPYEGQKLVTLHGSWAREGVIQTRDIGVGVQGTYSSRGISGHQDQPFLAVVSPGTDQEQGTVCGLHLVYSGSFLAQVQRDQHDSLRAVIGVHPDGFCWKLEPGEAFQTPEAVLVFSDRGLGQMTHTLHDLYRGHLIRGPWLHRPRPVLLNNWEATYFDFDEEKLLRIARRAAELGVELFVLDDGWFEDRHTDSGGLGDWKVDRKKLPHGLDGLAERVNALGLKFGLWMEPEMVSPDSELYRAHPDWAIRTAGRDPMLCRDQYVLDLSRPEVEKYVWEKVSGTLKSANISYLKWDMNRPVTNLGSAGLPANRQGEIGHRYVLALYRLQERLTREFPDLLLENCCGGGGRFDPGMLFYSPQIWGSDDTDAVERLRIQEGLSMLYPLSSIGAHVSDCPNHEVGRVTPFETRGNVALAGTFGYELDVTRIPEEEQKQIPGQIERYHRFCGLVQSGDYYRLSSLQAGSRLDARMVVSKDRKQALVVLTRSLNAPNQRPKFIRLRGLDPSAVYADGDTGREYPGEVLLHIGLPVELPGGDFGSRLICLTRK